MVGGGMVAVIAGLLVSMGQFQRAQQAQQKAASALEVAQQQARSASEAASTQPPSTKRSPDAPGAPVAPAATDWRTAEASLLTDHVQLTSRDRFLKAGEAYFSPDASWIIFQAIPAPRPGQPPQDFYQMYVARLVRDAQGRVTGTEAPIQLSADGSSNTCGWFHPSEPGLVLFGSTLGPPGLRDVPGYQRNTGRYVWQFHSEMEIVTTRFSPEGTFTPLEPIFRREGYCAEASWSADGRYVLYANFDRSRSLALGRNHLDILIYDTKAKRHIPIVTADGYNGGPFFSPDGRSICYRSDRRGDSQLQLFVATLAFNEAGEPTGIEREFALTDNQHVNWAPYWHPSGEFLVYASSEVSHRNYEVFAIPVDLARLRQGLTPDRIPHVRLTSAPGADVLPVFSPDGNWLLWTAQRGPLAEGEDRPSSQLWIARFHRRGLAFPER